MELKRTLARHYMDMLEVLPPASFKRTGNIEGFLVGEPMNHNSKGEPQYTSYFQNVDDEESCIGEVMTVTEFDKVMEDIDPIIDAMSEAEPVNDKVEKELDLIDEYGLKVVNAFNSLFSPEDIDQLEESYVGEYESDEDFAQNMAEELGDIDREVRWPHNCIDWKKASYELMFDYCEEDGVYFRNY